MHSNRIFLRELRLSKTQSSVGLETWYMIICLRNRYIDSAFDFLLSRNWREERSISPIFVTLHLLRNLKKAFLTREVLFIFEKKIN